MKAALNCVEYAVCVVLELEKDYCLCGLLKLLLKEVGGGVK